MKKGSVFGVLAASAVASLIGSSAFAAEAHKAKEPKACYRSHCGKSVKGHEGQCAGTKVEGLTSSKACHKAGGAWTTEAGAEKFKKKS
jgi:hypothetical protein